MTGRQLVSRVDQVFSAKKSELFAANVSEGGNDAPLSLQHTEQSLNRIIGRTLTKCVLYTDSLAQL
jgi:hypothetical protein